MRLALALAFALALLAGCVDPSSPVVVTPFYLINQAEPGRATEFAFHLESTSPFKQDDLGVRFSGPSGWTFEPETETVVLRGKDTTSLIVRITPDANASFRPHEVEVFVGEESARVTVNVQPLGEEPLRAGIGTQVYYVLWYANGTLASTNDPALRRADLDVPVLDGPNATGSEPLKVYVGGERGVPPPEPYNSTGYVPVIEGFDARLRDAGHGEGMVAGETLAVRIAAEDAYTRPGNEDHVLYGEDLNFLVRVVTVDVLQARSCDLPVCPPTMPPGPDL